MAADLVPVDLETLAERINLEHEQCAKAMRAGLHHALEAGRLLLEAKAGLSHGAWLPWLQENCTMPERTAQLYMRLARELPAHLEADKSARLADLTITEAQDLLARHREPEPLRVAVREVIPPESREPWHLAITSSPVEPTEPRHLVLNSVPLTADHDEAAGGSAGPQQGTADRERWGVRGVRGFSCGEELEGAQTLAEAVRRLSRLAQQLGALERDGWELLAPLGPDGDLTLARR